MTRSDEEAIREILGKHIEAAIEEIAEEVVIEDMWWPMDCRTRMTDQLVHSIALMQESHSEASAEGC